MKVSRKFYHHFRDTLLLNVIGVAYFPKGSPMTLFMIGI